MRNIYLVTEHGGTYEDSWNMPICAFETFKEAEAYCDDERSMDNAIDDELFGKIQVLRGTLEYELENKYYNENNELREGLNERDYYKELDTFCDKTFYDIIQKEFDVKKSDYERKERYNSWGGIDYEISEIPFND